MKSSCALLIAILLGAQAAGPYRTALPGYRYEFPRDDFAHPEFQTEWWYTTGNLQSADGHKFGFELTFFRQAVDREKAGSIWDAKDLYFAHFALSDLSERQFYHQERTNRAGPGIAGASEQAQRIWNGNWFLELSGENGKLSAVSEDFSVDLKVRSEKTPVIHGENGVSQKAAGAGRASHYISRTRQKTAGTVVVKGKRFEVSGLSWMDHEFFTHQLDGDQAGWDWLSLQLADNTELMLFHIRKKDGSIDTFSSGTFVRENGNTTHLRSDEFLLEPTKDVWRSPITGATYPIAWRVQVPSLQLSLEVKTLLASQELSGKTKIAPNYWEGAIFADGSKGSVKLSGVGYLEMTGYDKAVRLGD